MSDFKSYKKADLAKVAKKFGVNVRSKDTKQSLLEKVESFLEQSPDKADMLASLESDDNDSVDAVTLVEEVVATEDESEDSSESDESSQEQETVAANSTASVADTTQTSAVDEDDESDKDYDAPPPLDIKEWLVDPAIAAFENVHDRLLQFTDTIGATTLECNSDLRETLSATVTLNTLEIALEIAFYLYFYVPVVPLKNNRAIHQVFFDNIPFLKSCTWPSPDISALSNFTVASIFGNWALFAVVVPLLISYYVNFSRRVVQFEADDDSESDAEEIEQEYENEIDEEEVDEEENLIENEDYEGFSVVVRAYRFDPFIFALSKVLIYYFIHKSGALISLDQHTGVCNALKNLVFIQLGIYHTFVVSLGNLPLVLGLANVVIALYAQFEDY